MALPPFHVHLDVLACSAGSVVAAYLLAARRHERATGERLEAGRRTRFLGGVAVLLPGRDWPIHDLAESYLYSMHMVQHMLFTFVARAAAAHGHAGVAAGARCSGPRPCERCGRCSPGRSWR